jgi:hypothetical protein
MAGEDGKTKGSTGGTTSVIDPPMIAPSVIDLGTINETALPSDQTFAHGQSYRHELH